MKRKMTPKEVAKVAYFIASLLLVAVTCEYIPLCMVAVVNLGIAAKVLRTINVDELIED